MDTANLPDMYADVSVLVPVGLAGVAGAFLRATRTGKRIRRVKTGDRQGDAYVAVLVAVSWRQRRRLFDTRPLGAGPTAVHLTFDPYRPPKWRKIEAELRAAGSESVCAAAQAASAADLAVTETFAKWTQQQTEDNRSAALQARKGQPTTPARR
jgi:hypothetical protein